MDGPGADHPDTGAPAAAGRGADRGAGRDIDAVGLLADTARRRLYEYVVAQPDAVGREEAAGATGVPAHSARFHLERLVDAGMLEVEFRRLSGRTGPGAGRPSKLYRRADREVQIALPPRRYDLVGEVLAAAVERSLDGAPLAVCLAEEARRIGVEDAGAAAEDGTAEETATGPEAELARAAGVLADRGYEPLTAADGLVLRNCPFDALAREHTTLVCGVNHDYVTGVLAGLDCSALCACLDPAEDRCCVRVTGR